jgi:putative FmdB family regulatory protein
MPTYDYECDACGHTWELFQKITADPETKCPSCKKKKARRLFGTGAALMFKGSGFYETDYRSESYKKSAQADQSSGDSNSTGSDSGSDKASKSSEAGTSNSESKSGSKPESKANPDPKSDSGKGNSRRKPKPE